MAATTLTDKGVIVTGENLHLIYIGMNRLEASKANILFTIGGASGIGLATVHFFATNNAKIAILDISDSAGVKVLSDLRIQYPNVTFSFKKCDVRDWENQKQVFEEVYKEFGSIDVVFANAGVTEQGHLINDRSEEPTKPILTTVDINLYGTLYCEYS
jgi:NAD(P)-dependent dehydrogenase (short-subunit alcohol dehydrogenase family)